MQMCIQNRFHILSTFEPEYSNTKLVEDCIIINQKNNTGKRQLMAPEKGFQLCMNKKTRKAIKSGAIELKTEGQLRTTAFETLADKKLICKKLQNTEMCKYTLQGKQCPRINCYFAHCSKDLRLIPCFFGTSCRHVNDKSKPCRYLHPTETIEEYTLRINKINTESKDNVPVLK